MITFEEYAKTYHRNVKPNSFDYKHLNNEFEAQSENLMGVMIEMFENDRPTPEPNKEWEDVDGIQALIRVFFIGHLCKMLGVKNKYSAEYEEYMARYSADIPEDTACDDSEDIYDYLMEHGFSEDSAAEESEAEDINDSD